MGGLEATAGAVLGTVWGSFCGVLIDRVPSYRPFIMGRSRCDRCGVVLRASDLVPVLSWLSRRGRCVFCGEPISVKWTLVELACGALFAIIAVTAPDLWSALLFAPFAGILLALSIIDLEHLRLPNAIVYPTAAVSVAIVALGTVVAGAFSVSAAVSGAAVYAGMLMVVVVASRGGMGLGDVKLAAVIGFVVGAVDLPAVGVAAAAAVLLGGTAGVVALARGAGRRASLPFGPMLATGAFIAMVAGPRLADAYLRLLR